MINEEKVILMTKLASYETHEGKKDRAGYGLPKVTFNCRGKAWEGLPERVRAP